jgi:hypothetical protein
VKTYVQCGVCEREIKRSTLAIGRRGEVALGWQCHGKFRINPKRRQHQWVLIRTQACQISPRKSPATLRRRVSRIRLSNRRLASRKAIVVHVTQGESPRRRPSKQSNHQNDHHDHHHLPSHLHAFCKKLLSDRSVHWLTLASYHMVIIYREGLGMGWFGATNLEPVKENWRESGVTGEGFLVDFSLCFMVLHAFLASICFVFVGYVCQGANSLMG